MSWIVAGLMAPFLWALTNLIDQIKVRKYFVGNPLLITTLGGFVSTLLALYIAIFHRELWQIPFDTGIVFSTTAFFDCLAFLAYYKALQKDEASNVAPVFQILPILIFMMGYFFLKETISTQQIIGSAFIISAALCLMIDFKTHSFKWSTLCYMTVCCMVLATNTILNRNALEDTNWYTAIAWKFIGFSVFSIVVVCINKKIRSDCIAQIKNPINMGVFLLVTAEIAGLLANMCFLISLDKTPAAGLAMTLNGFQPAYVLLLTYVACKIYPQHFEKPKTGVHLIWHLGCLVAMIFGLYLIY